MRMLVGCAVVAAALAAGIVASSRPDPAFAQSSSAAGPVVGQVDDFREKSRPQGNNVYHNESSRPMAVTVIFEADTGDAVLFVRSAGGKFDRKSWTTGAQDRFRSATLDVEPGGSLWLKSERGVARWQLVSAVPNQL